MKQFEHLNQRIMRQPENEEQLVELENAVEEAKAKILPSFLDEYEDTCLKLHVSYRLTAANSPGYHAVSRAPFEDIIAWLFLTWDEAR